MMISNLKLVQSSINSAQIAATIYCRNGRSNDFVTAVYQPAPQHGRCRRAQPDSESDMPAYECI